MFSNTLEYAIESAIVSFNEYLSNKKSYISYTDADLKNAFIQRYRKATDCVEGNNILRIDSENLGKFSIKNDMLTELTFVKSGRWNCIGEDFINRINDIISKLNLSDLANTKLHIYSLEDSFSSAINAINNFKVRV